MGVSGEAGGPRGLDARLVLLLALLVGLLAWRGGPLAAAAFAAAAWAVVVRAGVARAERWRLLRRTAGLALLWGALRAGAALAAGAPGRDAAGQGGLLALRLVALLLLGAAVTVRLSPRALGVAAASLARPVLGRRAWEAALALALMIHFIPRALARFQAARQALRLRRLRLPRARAAALVLSAGARNLATGTWDQTLAIAARRLDRPEAWRAAGPPPPRDLALAALLGAAAVGLALLPV